MEVAIAVIVSFLALIVSVGTYLKVRKLTEIERLINEIRRKRLENKQ